MIKFRTTALGLLFALAVICVPGAANGQDRTTLSSILKHRGEQGVFCLNFRPDATGYRTKSCELRYGALYLGDDKDWLEVSAARGSRSVMKDLGLLNWDQAVTVPVVQPLPKLQPGEQRQISIDASGADGADGADGPDGLRGRDGLDADGVLRPKEWPVTNLKTTRRPARPKHDGKPRVDSMFVKAIVGHMYVIHVVNETDDFYVLFRVEEIERGSKCTISWRRVPAPTADVVQ